MSKHRGWCHCPMTWVYWTSPNIIAINYSHLVDQKYRSWLGDVKNGDMTNDPCFIHYISIIYPFNDPCVPCLPRRFRDCLSVLVPKTYAVEVQLIGLSCDSVDQHKGWTKARVGWAGLWVFFSDVTTGPLHLVNLWFIYGLSMVNNG